MAGIPIGWGSAIPGVYQVGLYVKFANLPTAPTALAQLAAGTVGNAVLAWWPDGQFMVDLTVNGNRRNQSIAPHLHVAVDTWYWVEMMWGHGHTGGGIGVGGQVWSFGGGVTDGPIDAGSIPDAVATTATTNLGWGVGLTTGYSDMRNETGTEMTALWLETVLDDNYNLVHLNPPPGVEPTVGSRTVALYLCHEPIGSATVTHDASSNHYDLDQGPNGLIVVRDAPY